MLKRVRKTIRYKNPLILMEMINAYFDECDALETPYTISGLCLSIGYSRNRLLEATQNDEIGEVIVQARLLIEQQHEHTLYTGKKPQGTIFALKNMGWVDRQQMDFGAADGSQAKAQYTIEVVRPDGTKKEITNEPEVPDSRKVVPFNPKEKAV